MQWYIIYSMPLRWRHGNLSPSTYDIHYYEPARRLCRLMGAPNVAWTVRTREEYEKAKKSYDLFIFEKVKL